MTRDRSLFFKFDQFLSLSSSANNFLVSTKKKFLSKNKHVTQPKMIIIVFEDLETDFVDITFFPPHPPYVNRKVFREVVSWNKIIKIFNPSSLWMAVFHTYITSKRSMKIREIDRNSYTLWEPLNKKATDGKLPLISNMGYNIDNLFILCKKFSEKKLHFFIISFKYLLTE